MRDVTAGGAGHDPSGEVPLSLLDPGPDGGRRGGIYVLAVSDEPDEALVANPARVRSVDLIVACGDLPFDYLGALMNALNVPLVFVPGNHDPDLSGYRTSRAGLTLRAGIPVRAPWPDGAVNADGRVVDVAGLRIAGLGGCLRYSAGPNQYTDRQLARRAMVLRARARRHRPRRGGGMDGGVDSGVDSGVDLLITHAPPRRAGDGDDPPHWGFTALHGLAGALRPTLLLHGHVHPCAGSVRPVQLQSGTRVVNVTGSHRIWIGPRVAVPDPRGGDPGAR